MAWPKGKPRPRAGINMKRPPQPKKVIEEAVATVPEPELPPAPAIDVKERGERTNDEKVRLGNVANTLLQNAAYLSALKDAEADIADRWRKTAPEDFEQREALHAEQRALDLIRRSLSMIESDGRSIRQLRGATDAYLEHRSHFRGAA
jgi:hypothetical protein